MKRMLPRLQTRQHSVVSRVKDRECMPGCRERYSIGSQGRVIARPSLRFHCYCHACGQYPSHVLNQIQSVEMCEKHKVIRGTHS